MAAEASSSAACSPSKERLDTMVRAVNMMAQGKRNMICGEVPMAVSQFQEACEGLAECYGEMAFECAEAYLLYGQSLLDLARMETGVIGENLPTGEDEEEEGDSSDDQDKSGKEADDRHGGIVRESYDEDISGGHYADSVKKAELIETSKEDNVTTSSEVGEAGGLKHEIVLKESSDDSDIRDTSELACLSSAPTDAKESRNENEQNGAVLKCDVGNKTENEVCQSKVICEQNVMEKYTAISSEKESVCMAIQTVDVDIGRNMVKNAKFSAMAEAGEKLEVVENRSIGTCENERDALKKESDNGKLGTAENGEIKECTEVKTEQVNVEGNGVFCESDIRGKRDNNVAVKKDRIEETLNKNENTFSMAEVDEMKNTVNNGKEIVFEFNSERKSEGRRVKCEGVTQWSEEEAVRSDGTWTEKEAKAGRQVVVEDVQDQHDGEECTNGNPIQKFKSSNQSELSKHTNLPQEEMCRPKDADMVEDGQDSRVKNIQEKGDETSSTTKGEEETEDEDPEAASETLSSQDEELKDPEAQTKVDSGKVQTKGDSVEGMGKVQTKVDSGKAQTKGDSVEGTGEVQTKGDPDKGTGKAQTKVDSVEGTGEVQTKGDPDKGTGEVQTKADSVEGTGEVQTKADSVEGTGEVQTKGDSVEGTGEVQTKGDSVEGTGEVQTKGDSVEGTGEVQTKGDPGKADSVEGTGEVQTKGDPGKADSVEGTGEVQTKGDPGKAQTKVDSDTRESDEEAGTNKQENGNIADDDVSNLQLAWEMLELSKVIYLRKETKESQLKAAQAYLKLGEVSLETEQYQQSIEDFGECLRIQQKFLEAEDRLVAETYYQLGLGFTLNGQHDLAVESYSKAVNVIEDRIAKLSKFVKEQSLSEEKKDVTEREAIYTAEQEISELKSVLPDIVTKIDDTLEEKKTVDQLKHMALEKAGSKFLQGRSDGLPSVSSLTSCSSPPLSSATDSLPFSSSSSFSSSLSQRNTKVIDAKPNDISHLIRRKRKPEEQKDAADTKRARNEILGSGDMPGKVDEIKVPANGFEESGDNLKKDADDNPEVKSDSRKQVTMETHS